MGERRWRRVVTPSSNHTGVTHEEKSVSKKPWTTAELAQVRKLAAKGAEAIAEELGRPVRSVTEAARRARISLRRSGERRGRVMGEPHKLPVDVARVRMLRGLRDDVLAGKVDLRRIERRVRLLATGMVCPGCGKRPQEVESSGLCEVCHLDNLTEAHRLERDRIEHQRALDGERQRKHRAKAKARA
jgi:hypothetical protein